MRRYIPLRIHLALLIIALVPMAAIAWYLPERYIAPPFNSFLLQPNPPRLSWPLPHKLWSDNPRGQARSLDLHLLTGEYITKPYNPYLVLGQTSDGSVFVPTFGSRSHVLRYTPGKSKPEVVYASHVNSARLLNDRYLVCIADEKLMALDLQTTSDGQPNVIPIAEVSGQILFRLFQMIEGKPFVFVCSRSGKPTISAYRLENGTCSLVQSWPTGGPSAIVYLNDEYVYSLNADNQSIDVRELDNLQLTKTVPAPPALVNSWVSATAGYNTLNYLDAQTGRQQTFHLSDCAIVADLAGWTARNAPVQTDRWQVFGTQDNSNRALKVFDAKLNKVTYHLELDWPLADARVLDDRHLAVVDRSLGLTCTVIDMHRGQKVAEYHPALWSIVLGSLLRAMVIAWSFAWLRYSKLARLSRPVEWGMLVLVVVCPCLQRSIATYWGETSVPSYVVLATMLVIGLWAGHDLWFGSRRAAYRICSWLAVVGALSWFCLWLHWVEPLASMAAVASVWSLFVSATLLSSLTIRWANSIWLGANDTSRPRPSIAEGDRQPLIIMSDWFWLSAAIAFLLVPIVGMKRGIIDFSFIMPYCLAGLVMAGVQSVIVWLLFSRFFILKSLGRCAAVFGCLVLVAEWPLNLYYALDLAQHSQWTIPLRIASVIVVVTAAWAWRINSAVVNDADRHRSY